MAVPKPWWADATRRPRSGHEHVTHTPVIIITADELVR